MRNIGINRGKPRIWLEGRELSDNGIKHGMRYDIAVAEGIIEITITPNGKRKIAGTKARPIIDMTGRNVAIFAAGKFDRFEIVKLPHGIELRGM